MALKKMGRPMKIITIIIALAMIIPVIVQVYSVFVNRETKTVMLKIDGEKIYKEDYDKILSTFTLKINEIESQFQKQLGKEYKGLPEEVVKGQVLASQISEAINNLLIRKLDVTVSKREINKKFKEIEDQVGGSKYLVASLNARGLKVEDFRKEIKNLLLNEKKIESIKSKIKVSDKELEDRYNQLKYSEYDGKNFAEVKEEIRDKILNSRALVYEFSLKDEIYEKAKFEVKDPTIKPVLDYLNEVVFEQDEYKYRNIDVVSQIINLFYNSRKSYDESFITLVKENLKKDLDKKIRIKDKALSVGLKLNESLGAKQQLEYIIEEYVFYVLNTYKANEKELKAIFETNREVFDIPHSVSGEILGILYHATEYDVKKTQEEAKELMKEITKENFAEYAKKYSIDGSAANGGNLGKVDINNFVAPFKQALIGAKEGQIIGPVKTDFGIHIIYLMSKDKKNPNLVESSHILLPIKISDETKAKAKEKVLSMKKMIMDKKVTWEEINSDKTGKYDEFEIKDHFSKNKIDTKLPRIGYNKDINNKLFNAKVNEFIEVEVSDAFIIIQKTEDIPYRKVSFDEVKDKLNYIAANNYLLKHLNEI